MIQHAIAALLEREIKKLQEEIKQYANEADMWVLKPGIGNSAGTLCLHLVGNLNHFIGATLGNTGYVRNRDAEFTTRNVPRQQLLQALEDTIPVVKNTLAALTADDLQKEYPLELMGARHQTGAFLLHLLTHFTYHLGQVNYHRRLLAVA